MVCLLFSFIAAALADTHGHHICYTAVGSASIVLILPVRKNIPFYLRRLALTPL